MTYDILNASSDMKASANAALTLLTGGTYTTCGSSSSQSYRDSYASAQEYVKKNIFNQIIVD